MSNCSQAQFLLVAIVVLLAGCAGIGSEPVSPDSPSNESLAPDDGTELADQSNESQADAASTDSPPENTSDRQATTDSSQPAEGTPSEGNTPRGATDGVEWTVTVTRVIDGDTVEARFPNGEVDTIRLLGVDTPETTYNAVSPDEFPGISDDTTGRDHLLNWGENASGFATRQLENTEVRLVVDQEADRRGYYGRLLAYIYVDGQNFNKELLSRGYARLYESDFSKRTSFEEAERTAQNNGVGLWEVTGESGDSPGGGDTGETSSTLVVTTIHVDAAGNDHNNLNDEYVTFENIGEETLNMGGWTVLDEAGHSYTMPETFDLAAGESVTLHTGTGVDTASELYWGAERARWNNAGDTIILEDTTGTVVLRRDY